MNMKCPIKNVFFLALSRAFLGLTRDKLNLTGGQRHEEPLPFYSGVMLLLWNFLMKSLDKKNTDAKL